MNTKILRILSIISITIVILINVTMHCNGQTPTSIDDVDKLQKESLDQLQLDLQHYRDEIIIRKAKELDIMENSNLDQLEKQKQKVIIESKYLTEEKALEKQFSQKQKKMTSYYTQMKNNLHKVKPLTPKTTKRVIQKHIAYVPPQELIDNWAFKSSFRYVGTLKFINDKNVVAAKVYFLRYNKWDDIFNLTYDGYNIAFDYENPYGVNLHFDGKVNQKATVIKGKFVDLKTKKIYSWKAFR